MPIFHNTEINIFGILFAESCVQSFLRIWLIRLGQPIFSPKEPQTKIKQFVGPVMPPSTNELWFFSSSDDICHFFLDQMDQIAQEPI